MFGYEDLQMGDIGIKLSNSDNLTFNLSYTRHPGNTPVYVKGGLIYRNYKRLYSV